MPMNDSVICERTANPTVPTKPAAMIAVRFGRISAVMIRHVLSPLARAASTKSRRRSDSVWARSTRAPHAQPVDGDDERDRHAAGRGQLARDDDDERQLRDHEEHVGEHRQALVAEPADVARGDADDHADRRRDDAGDEADDHDAAGADEDLREDVLPEVRGAEPVLPRRRLQDVVAARARVVRRDPRADDRDQEEEPEDHQAGDAPSSCAGRGTGACRPRGARWRPARSSAAPRRIAVSIVMSALLTGARVEHAVDEVGHDVGEQHGERDHQEAALHERVVLRRHRGEQDSSRCPGRRRRSP